jgi:hypothetical protein
MLMALSFSDLTQRKHQIGIGLAAPSGDLYQENQCAFLDRGIFARRSPGKAASIDGYPLMPPKIGGEFS